MLNIFSKKGISPIIATVLLVVITIAIGATTMAFIRSLTDTQLESAKVQGSRLTCGSEVQLEIPIVSSKYKICYYNTTGAISMLLHNTGSKDVKGFSLTTILSNGTVMTTDFDDPATDTIVRNEYKSFNLTPSPEVDYTTANVTQWRIEPMIQGDPGKELTTCSDSAILRDNDEISLCE
jgi:flagellin-like protein